ncbi:MAG TPA: hypothetical protein VGS07_07335 [Thermoanaerobaculia bacterium]|jgi:hypothetical protein|nr:hypothetical protein [Thermoanaerobaculia bacterium]
MIAFVTLLLGLISGVYPIEVKVGESVTAVEYRLDGVLVERREGPPWVARVDLGTGLRPRVLSVHAFDAGGQEIAHATQWLNLPRPPAEVEIVLEKDPQGGPTAAQLTWQSVNGVRPATIGLTLDGKPLKVDGNGRALLPKADLKLLHVLTAELWFPPGVLARKDVAFGGEYGSDVSTELTAVPVRLRSGAALPAPEGLQEWFTAAGQPASAVAVEDGPGKVIVVRVPTGREVLDELVPRVRRATALPALRQKMPLGKEDSVRFLSLSGNRFRSSKIPSELFDMSTELTATDGGLFWLLSNSRPPKEAKGPARRIADAVAVAGLQATAANRRRAVVLVLGGNVTDSSHYDPEAVRRYLESVHVPLFIWYLYGAQTPGAKSWSGGEDISTLDRLEQATARLRTALDSQRIVWLDGRHLPQSIALTPAARGVELP